MTDTIVNHAADVSVASRMGLITSRDISYESFILAVIYDNAVAEKHQRDRDKGGKGGAAKGGKTVSGAKGMRSFMAAARKAKEEVSGG